MSSKQKPETGLFSNSMAYAKLGSGARVLLMIPGGPGNTMPTGWALNMTISTVRPLLEDGFTIYLVTRKRNMPEGYSVADMAADYAELIRSEFGGKVDLIIGSSYGGMIAQFIAANHPECFSNIVIQVAACRVENAERDYAFAKALHEGRTRAGFAIMMQSLFPKPPMRWFAGIGAWLSARQFDSTAHDYARHDVLVEAEAELAFDARPILPKIKGPVLLVNGDQDAYFPMKWVAETAHLIADCTSIIYPGKNHMSAAMDKRFLGDVRTFIAR
ncbi:MAG: alpha/beta hydrolase [Pseudomonadota bacterium]